MKKFFSVIGILLLVLVAILLINTFTFKSKQVQYPAIEQTPLSQSAIAHMQEAIRYVTISHENANEFNGEPFLAFHKFLAQTYPLADSLLKPEVVNNYSLLYTWQGSNPAAKPVILMAHIDVVPVDEPTKNEWQANPYAGDIVDESIWGRGSMDDKASLIAIMEAVEQLLQEGYQPVQTIYLAFGHDEEIGGNEGAAFLAKTLAERGVQAEFVLDEGGFILQNFIPAIKQPVALIATAEKGFLTLELTVTTNGGHSSMPTRENAIGTLATAVHDLENHQFDYKMIKVTEEFIDHLGPEMPFGMKLVFANKWLFGGMILKGMTNHTTIAPTIFNSGVKDNVLPTKAVAKINHRILPGETSEEVVAHVTKAINNDRVKIKVVAVNEPSKITDSDTEVFNMLAKTIVEVMPGTIVTPGLTPGGTDTKHYTHIADYVYRFSPIRFEVGTDGPHSVNEHLPLVDYQNSINFYYRLIANLSAK
jgi:carboxypeptidase PM20D1